MVIITTLLACIIVTIIARIFGAGFGQNFIAKHCYILEQYKNSQLFTKKICSQILQLSKNNCD
jgi:hypothetical protein